MYKGLIRSLKLTSFIFIYFEVYEPKTMGNFKPQFC